MTRGWALLPWACLVACSAVRVARRGSESGDAGKGCDRTVSFLFLAKEGLPFERVWRKYLDGCAAGSYTVHVHSQNLTRPPASLPEARVLADPIQGNLRRNYTMQQAMHKLYRDALESRAPNGCRPRWAQLLSESCGPVRGCAEYQDFLGKHPGTSFLESWLCTVGAKRDACYCRKPGHWMTPWYKAHQWSTLWMDHAKMLVDTEKEKERVWMKNPLPDEHYTINELDAMGARHEAFGLTHVYPFLTGRKGHPGSISCTPSVNLRRGIVDFNASVQDVVTGKRFFARKYSEACEESLLRQLPDPTIST